MTEINVFDKSCSFLHFDRDVEFTQLKGNLKHTATGDMKSSNFITMSIFVNFEGLCHR